MSNYIYIATSLDGYIATPDGKVDWLTQIPNLSGSDYGFSDFIDGIDAIIMGRKTFDTVKNFDFWPYKKHLFLLSNSIIKLESKFDGLVTIIHGDVPTILRRLREEGYKNLYIDGGFTIQSFLEHDLIDELIITTAPIILGKGIPLFREMDKIKTFKHIKTEVLDNIFVKSHYIKE